MKQVKLIRSESSTYGGDLLKTRKGRSRGRPIDTKRSMHLVLRSSKAKGTWSFRSSRNSKRVYEIITKFSSRYAIHILSMANVGNHLHFHIQLTHRQTYKPFIRAITSAIAMAVTGVSRWNKTAANGLKPSRLHFWDQRPFTRIIIGFRAILNLTDYIRINQLEGLGYTRSVARHIITTRNETPT